MPLIDEQGRVLGRLNIVDLAAVLVVGLLIPLGYGAYLLFSPQAPRILAIEPARVPQGTAQVAVRGEHLRPYLRMTVGTVGTTFLFATPEGGVLQLPPLPPGSYDVVILDEDQEVARLRDGFAIEAPRPRPSGTLMATGVFPALASSPAQALWRNLRAPDRKADWGEIIGVQPPEPNLEYLPPASLPISDGSYQVRAVLRFECRLEQRECKVGTIALTPGATIPLELGGSTVNFRIDDLHPPYTERVEILMRCYVTSEEFAMLQAWNPAAQESFPAWAALRPSLVSFDVVGEETVTKQLIVNVRARVPAVETPAGWTYGGRVLRIGETFQVERPSQQLSGRVVGIRRLATTGTGRQ